MRWRDMAPSRTSRGAPAVRSTIDESPPGQEPPSNTASIIDPKPFMTCSAVVGAAPPLRLALGAVSGPEKARSRRMAMSPPGTRSATVAPRGLVSALRVN